MAWSCRGFPRRERCRARAASSSREDLLRLKFQATGDADPPGDQQPEEPGAQLGQVLGQRLGLPSSIGELRFGLGVGVSSFGLGVCRLGRLRGLVRGPHAWLSGTRLLVRCSRPPGFGASELRAGRSGTSSETSRNSRAHAPGRGATELGLGRGPRDRASSGRRFRARRPSSPMTEDDDQLLECRCQTQCRTLAVWSSSVSRNARGYALRWIHAARPAVRRRSPEWPSGRCAPGLEPLELQAPAFRWHPSRQQMRSRARKSPVPLGSRPDHVDAMGRVEAKQRSTSRSLRSTSRQ